MPTDKEKIKELEDKLAACEAEKPKKVKKRQKDPKAPKAHLRVVRNPKGRG